MLLPQTFATSLIGLLATLTAAQQAGPAEQPLAAALTRYPQLSTFARLISSNATLASILSPSGGISDGGVSTRVTILVPDDAALAAYYKLNGAQLGDSQRLAAILRYHVMAAPVTAANFSARKADRGLTVPTLLRESAFNNRSAGGGLEKDYGADGSLGNVLYLSKSAINPVLLRVRQAGGGEGGSVSIRGGLGGTASVKAVDAPFDGGFIQIIDSVLSPPMSCSNTIRGASLTGLDNALNRSGLWDMLNSSKNVTCLAPNNAAFKAAGNPDSALNQTALQGALGFHTLNLPLYSSYMTDNSSYESLGGPKVTVRFIGDDIYFNDAKVVSPNVITNNGVIHVLDKVMSVDGKPPGGGEASPSPSTGGTLSIPSPTPSSTTKPNGSTSSFEDRWRITWLGLMGSIAVGCLL